MKKLLIVIAVLMALTIVLAACDRTQPVTPPPVETTTTVATTQAVGETTTTEPPTTAGTEVPDLGGREIRMTFRANAGSGYKGIFEEDGTWRVPNPEAGNYHHQSLQYNNRVRVEEMFNFVLVPVHLPDAQIFETMSTAIIAGDIHADVSHTPTAVAIRALVRGYTQPLEPLAEMLPGVDLDIFGARLYAWPCTVVDGLTWNFTRPLPNMNNQGIFVNLALIEAFGAPNPVELYERGQWTWDAMRQIMEMTTADTTGDGNIDTWGASGNLGAALRHLMIANGTVSFCPDTLQLNHNTPEAMAALEFVYEIIANGWFMPGDPEHAAPARGSSVNDLAFGQGLTALGISTTPGNMNNQFQAGLEAETTAWVPFPLGPNNTDGRNSESGGRGGAAIMAMAEDPHYLLWIIDQLHHWPGDEWYEMEYSADLEWARRFMATEADVQRIYQVGVRGQRMDLGYRAGITGGFHQDMVNSWWFGEMTVAQSVEYWFAERQAMADEFFAGWTPGGHEAAGVSVGAGR